MRPDRLPFAMTEYVKSIMGNKLTYQASFNIDEQFEFKNSSFPHLHVFLIGSRHGGQLPKWHFNGQLCPQG